MSENAWKSDFILDNLKQTIFLHYLLQQDKNSMIFQVLKATRENHPNNDFVKNI